MEKSHNYCNISSRTALIHALLEDPVGINVTVKACFSACQLILGTGNANISGIGVMTSYIIQIAVTFVTGSLCVLSLYFERHGPAISWLGRRFKTAQARIIDAADAVAGTNLFLGLSIAACATFELSQRTVISEGPFLDCLNALELYCTFYALICRLILSWLRKPSWPLRMTYLVATVLYLGLGCASIYFASPTYRRTSTIAKMVLSCGKSYSKYEWLVNIMKTSWQVNSQITLVSTWSVISVVWVVACLGLYWISLSLKSGPYLRVILPVTVSFLPGAIIMAISLEGWRQTLRELSESDNGDSNWNFGQVAPVAAWAPVLLLGLFTCIGLFRKDARKDDEEEQYEQQQPDNSSAVPLTRKLRSRGTWPMMKETTYDA